MNEANYQKLKAAYEKACQERSDLLQRIQEAEGDLKEMAALMTNYESQGKQGEYEEVSNAYQQAYPDYTGMLRQLALIEEPLDQMASHLNAIDDYIRDTGLYPGGKVPPLST